MQKKAEERWGAGVVEQVSLDLQREFPNADGFSERNLWYMKQWYLFYTGGKSQILQRPIAEMPNEKLQRVVGEFPQLFSMVPWGQHVEIITRCKTIDEAVFYLHRVIDNGLSRPALVNCIKANLYAHQGKIVSNFQEQLPQLQSRLVQEVLKENYDFGFATVGLLICSDMNKAHVQWSFKGISTPIGVATYNNIRIKDMLPTQEQLKERMELLQKELRETKRLMTNDKTCHNL